MSPTAIAQLLHVPRLAKAAHRLIIGIEFLLVIDVSNGDW
jgi:hypothetical protein